MGQEDPREIIDRLPMSAFQWRVFAVMVGLNALDGFDVLSISFASPAIARTRDLAPSGGAASRRLTGSRLTDTFHGRM
jgi:hypothetical protein